MPLSGRTPAIRVASGEGPWYYAQGAPVHMDIPDCAVGDTIVCWAYMNEYPQLTNAEMLIDVSNAVVTGFIFPLDPPTLNLDTEARVFMVRCTVAGTVNISGFDCVEQRIIAHKTAVPAIHV